MSGCSYSLDNLRGTYFGVVDKEKILFLDISTYYYKYNGKIILEGQLKKTNGKLYFYNFSLSKICSDVPSMDDLTTHSIDYDRSGNIVFFEGVPCCNFIHE